MNVTCVNRHHRVTPTGIDEIARLFSLLVVISNLHFGPIPKQALASSRMKQQRTMITAPHILSHNPPLCLMKITLFFCVLALSLRPPIMLPCTNSPGAIQSEFSCRVQIAGRTSFSNNTVGNFGGTLTHCCYLASSPRWLCCSSPIVATAVAVAVAILVLVHVFVVVIVVVIVQRRIQHSMSHATFPSMPHPVASRLHGSLGQIVGTNRQTSDEQ